MIFCFGKILTLFTNVNEVVNFCGCIFLILPLLAGNLDIVRVEVVFGFFLFNLFALECSTFKHFTFN